MLRLWGRTSSINVRKVLWCLQELGLPFERIEAGGPFGRVNEACYLARNPNAMVPLLEDGDFCLWESNVIVRYLCARAGSAMYPMALQARFDTERWMDWQQTTLNPAGRDAFLQWVRTPADQRQPRLIADSVARTEPLLDLLERQLQRQPFLAGEAMTMADLPVACEVHRWFGLPQPRPTWPALERWYAGLRQRPAAHGVLDLPLS